MWSQCAFSTPPLHSAYTQEHHDMFRIIVAQEHSKQQQDGDNRKQPYRDGCKECGDFVSYQVAHHQISRQQTDIAEEKLVG